MIDENVERAIRRDVLLVEEKYYNVYFSRQNVEYNYGEIFQSDRERDEAEIRAVYNRVLGVLRALPSGDSRVAKWEALFMARLSELETDYGAKLEKIETAITGIESAYLIQDNLYEYVLLLFEKGTYLLDRRENMDVIERCFVKAEDAIRLYDSGRIGPQAFIPIQASRNTSPPGGRAPTSCARKGIEGQAGDDQLARKQAKVMDDWRHLKAKVYLARAIFRADTFDRIDAGEIEVEGREQCKRFQLEEEKLYLKLAEKALRRRKEFGKGVAQERLIRLPKLDEEGELLFLPRGLGYDQDKSVNLNYLSTRAFYHLRRSRQLGAGDNRQVEQIIQALRCYVAGYLYDIHNMISMDNIAYICYSFGGDKRFIEALRGDLIFRQLYRMFGPRLQENLKNRVAHTLACQMLAGILDKVKKDIKAIVMTRRQGYADEDAGWLEVSFPEAWISQLWKQRRTDRKGGFSGLEPLFKEKEDEYLQKGVETYFRYEEYDGMQPCPLLPPWRASADIYMAENEGAFRQIVDANLERCWNELGDSLVRAVNNGEEEASDYYLYVDGLRKVKVGQYRRHFEEPSRSQDVLGRIAFRQEAERGICEAAERSLREAGLRIGSSAGRNPGDPNPYELLDWLFTVSRGG